MTEKNQEVRIAYVNLSGLNDEDIQKAIAGSTVIVQVPSERFNSACNYLGCGVYRGNIDNIETNIKQTNYNFLNQNAAYIRNGLPHAEAIVLSGKRKDLVSAVEVLGLPHGLDE